MNSVGDKPTAGIYRHVSEPRAVDFNIEGEGSGVAFLLSARLERKLFLKLVQLRQKLYDQQMANF